jgi:hypothetical protein
MKKDSRWSCLPSASFHRPTFDRCSGPELQAGESDRQGPGISGNAGWKKEKTWYKNTFFRSTIRIQVILGFACAAAEIILITAA